MNSILKPILCALAICLLCVTAMAQNLRPGVAGPDPKMLSGSVSGGGLSNLYSPNLYDGSAQVTIPIFEYKTAEGADFGVSLGYNTKGVLVNEIASDVGLHWNVYSGPRIYRTVKDLPDEVNLLDGDTMSRLSSVPIHWTPDVGIPPNLYDSVRLNKYWAFKGRLAVSYESAGSQSDSLVYRDSEADDFTVSLGGTSFSFNFASDGTIFTIPKKNIKVVPLWGGQVITATTYNQHRGGDIGDGNLLGFRIEDEQGNKYLFEKGDYDYRDVYDLYGMTMPMTQTYYSSQWIIKEITLSNGNTIKYNYRTFQGCASCAPQYITHVYNELHAASTGSGLHKEPTYPNKLFISKLLDISYPNGTTVNFVYETYGRPDYIDTTLREIKVSAPGNCLRYQMDQAFFVVSATNPEVAYNDVSTVPPAGTPQGERARNVRLKLKGVRLLSCDGTINEPYYSFEYSSVAVPMRMDSCQDYFGYYNGPNSGNCGIPYHPLAWLVDPNNNNITYDGSYGINRNANVQYAQAGILKTVNNAYGGSATFYYGAHQLSNVLQGLPTDPQFLGVDANDGLRLDSIIEVDRYHASNKKITRFSYSGGQRFLTGGYFHNFILDAYSSAYAPNYPYYHLRFTNTYLTTHQFVNGSNHGYSDVTITTVNGENGSLLGKKTIKFSNFQDAGGSPKYTIVGGGKHYYQYPYPDKQFIRDWELGLPLEITEYDQNNRIVQQTVNKYEPTIDSTSSIGKVQNIKKAYVTLRGLVETGIRAWAQRLYTDPYRPYRGKSLLRATTIKKYVSDVAFIKDSTTYGYDDHDNLDYIITINSKGDVVRTSQVYNYEVQQPNATILAMNNAGLEKIVGMERRTSNKMLDVTVNTFSYTNGKLLPKDLYKLTIAEPLDYTTFASSTGSVTYSYNYINTAFAGTAINYFDKVSTVTLADAKGNPTENQLLGMDLYKAMLWDTITSQKLAEVSNARYNEIAYTGFDQCLTGFPISTTWIEQGRIRFQVGGMSNSAGTMAGQTAYRLQPTGAGSSVICSGLTPNKPYKISFWAKSGVPSIAGGGVSSFNLTTPLPAINGWINYVGTFTPTNNTDITFTAGTTIYIDEIRIHPVGALMQTQTYLPLFGIDSQTDATGRIAKFEYDKLGRQTIVRNQEGQIISKKETNIQVSE